MNSRTTSTIMQSHAFYGKNFECIAKDSVLLFEIKTFVCLSPSCQNHYEVLQLPRNATNQEIVDSYKNLARLVHPGSMLYGYFSILTNLTFKKYIFR